MKNVTKLRMAVAVATAGIVAFMPSPAQAEPLTLPHPLGWQRISARQQPNLVRLGDMTASAAGYYLTGESIEDHFGIRVSGAIPDQALLDLDSIAAEASARRKKHLKTPTEKEAVLLSQWVALRKIDQGEFDRDEGESPRGIRHARDKRVLVKVRSGSRASDGSSEAIWNIYTKEEWEKVVPSQIEGEPIWLRIRATKGVLYEAKTKSVVVVLEPRDYRHKSYKAEQEYFLAYQLPTDKSYIMASTPVTRTQADPTIVSSPQLVTFPLLNALPSTSAELLGSAKQFVLDPKTGNIVQKDVAPKKDVSIFEFKAEAPNIYSDIPTLLFGGEQPYTILKTSGRIATESKVKTAYIDFDSRSILSPSRGLKDTGFRSLIGRANQSFDSIQIVGAFGFQRGFYLDKNSFPGEGKFVQKEKFQAPGLLAFATEVGYYPEFDKTVFGREDGKGLPSAWISRFRVELDTRPVKLGGTPLFLQGTSTVYVNPDPMYAGGVDARTFEPFYRLSMLIRPGADRALRISYIGGSNATTGFERISNRFEFSVDLSF